MARASKGRGAATTARPVRPAGAASRRPTYGAAARLVQVYLKLERTRRGRDIDGIAREIGVSRKTVERYAKVLVDTLVGEDGQPLVELVRPGGNPHLRLRSAEIPSNAYQAASMFLAATALRSLGPTVLAQGADDAWDGFKSSLPQRSRDALGHIERKFAYFPFAPKRYEHHDETLDILLRAVLGQKVLDLRYRRPDGRRHAHEFRPYSLVLYRDGLYLLGKSERHRRPIYLAIDRILEAKMRREGFDYPADFNPLAHADGVFGIWSGAETQVSLRLTGRAAEQIPERLVRPDQTFTPLRGGAILMRFTVHGWQELAWWILSWGGEVEVQEPADLRRYVRREVRAAAALYRR